MSRFIATPTSVLATGLVTLLSAAMLPAQDPQSAQTPFATIPYIDKAFGFELELPAGWNYDRTGFFGPGASLGLLRGSGPDGRSTLQILAFRQLQTPGFRQWIEYFSTQLSGITGIKQVRVKGEPDAERPAAYIVAEARLGFEQTRTLYYCVQFDPDTIWVLSYAFALPTRLDQAEDDEVPDSAADVAIPGQFTRLTDTLRIFYDPEFAQKLAVALQRGKDYLTRYQLQADIGKLRIDESVRYYEIRVAGRPIGFLSRRFSRESEPLQRPGRISNAKEGLRVRERSYRFAADGTTYFSKIDLFSSRDGETDLYELWEARIPPPETADSKPIITRDQCVREGETLFSTYTTSRSPSLPSPRRPIKLEATYLGLAWVRALPALLGPEPQSMRAFTIYDPESRTVVSHAVRARGEQPLPGRPAQQAHVFEMRVGFVEEPTVLYTDALGNMLRLECGELILNASTKTAIEKEFGQRRAEAEARLQAGR